MALTRERILETALEILSAYGLGDLSMRRLAAELEVAPGALYYHVKNKQELLAQLAHRLLDAAGTHEADDVPDPAAGTGLLSAPTAGSATGPRPGTGPDTGSGTAEPILTPGAPPEAHRAAAEALKRALAVRESLAGIPDAADVVSLAMALRPEAVPPLTALAASLEAAGLDPERSGWAARTILYTVLGFVGGEQSRAQAGAEAGSAADACAFGVRAVLRGLFL